MEFGREMGGLLEACTSSSAVSSSILSTAGESEESSFRIFLLKKNRKGIRQINMFRRHHDFCWRILTGRRDAWRESPVSSACLQQAVPPPILSQEWSAEECVSNSQMFTFYVNVFQSLFYVVLKIYIVVKKRHQRQNFSIGWFNLSSSRHVSREFGDTFLMLQPSLKSPSNPSFNHDSS